MGSSFFRLIEELENQAARTAMAAETQTERRNVVTSLAGRQAPLGYRDDGPAELRDETSRNNGAPAMRRQIIGNVNAERVNAVDSKAAPLVEGRDDEANRRPAPRRRNTNGVRRRNVHLFGAENNDPSARFGSVVRGFESLDALTQAVSQAFAAPSAAPPLQQTPPRLLIAVMRDYNEAFQMLQNATDESQRALISRGLAGFNAELANLCAAIPVDNRNGESEPGSN